MSFDEKGLLSAWAVKTTPCPICKVPKGQKCIVITAEDIAGAHRNEPGPMPQAVPVAHGTHLARTEAADTLTLPLPPGEYTVRVNDVTPDGVATMTTDTGHSLTMRLVDRLPPSSGDDEQECPDLDEPTRLRLLDHAREKYANDDLEIDDNAKVSLNDEGGAWVAAWVYVRLEDLNNDEDGDEK